MIFTWLFGQWRTIGMVALSTVLIYLTTVGAVRVSERRTLAEMSTFDFVVAVAIGAIVGRTATTPPPSYVQGVVAVFTLAAAHRCLGWARMRWAGVRQVMEREPLIVVLDGRPCRAALRRGHLTEADLAAAAREHGLSRLDQAHMVVMEANGRFSVIRADQPPLDGPPSARSCAMPHPAERPIDVDLPHVLRAYALVADGERGAVIGPTGEVAWLCFPGWGDDPVFASLLGGQGHYQIRPTKRFIWGGQYDEGSLVWRNHWLIGRDVTDCVEALAFPGRADRAVLVRRVIAEQGPAEVAVRLELRDDFGNGHPARLRRVESGIWEGRFRGLHIRWQPYGEVRWSEAAAHATVRLDPGAHADFTLELSTIPFDDEPADADQTLTATTIKWRDVAPPTVQASYASRDIRHAVALLQGMTTSSGAMVAAATTSLPERADQGRNYDYRYAWIRDQCYTGIAAARAGGPAEALLDNAVRFVHQRLLADGAKLRPTYRPDGLEVPAQRAIELPGYPGAATVISGNPAGEQFQLDIFGEALSLFAAGASRDRLEGDVWRAAEVAAAAIEQRWTEPDAGVWEVRPARYTHSRLACVAGLRALGRHAPKGSRTGRWLALADSIMAKVAATSVHRTGRWQRADDDDRVDAALLLAAIRGALPVDDPRMEATLASVHRDLMVDGYTYRYPVDNAPLGQAEGAFLLCGFWLAEALHLAGDGVGAAHLFERNRAACGPPGIYTEEYDTHQRQLRGNFPQAFVHAALLETAVTLSDTTLSKTE